jgi:hypothetical protein
MYFDSNQIKSKLICKKYEGRLDEPRLLPCGKNTCSYCIAYIKVLNKEFQCLTCDKVHEMPKNGLPINEVLIEILSFQPVQVSRGKALDSLQELLNEIQNTKNLRNQIQLITEESLLQINDLSENMLNELDEYEQKLLLTTGSESNRSNLNLLQNSLKFAQEIESFQVEINQLINF